MPKIGPRPSYRGLDNVDVLCTWGPGYSILNPQASQDVGHAQVFEVASSARHLMETSLGVDGLGFRVLCTN